MSKTGNRLRLLISLAIIACVAAFAAPKANAAFTITSWTFTPSSLQAAGHPNVSFRLNPDAAAGDQTGDDLKTVKIDFSAGMLANPQAVTTPCTATQFNADACPAATQIGTISAQYRKGGLYFSMPGSMYEITPDADSALTFGFVVRPTGFKKFFLKSSKVTGVTTVRTGLDADYGLTATIDSIPRTLTTTFGTVTNVTISDVTVNLFARSGATQNGPYFTFAPTRCTPAVARATMVSYLGVTVVKTAGVTPTGCDKIPFNPSFSVTPATNAAGAATGITASLSVPTADAAIQNSHVKDVVTTLPKGTGLDLANIGAVAALCTNAQLAADACPAGSKIGTAAVNVPFLPPTMTGGIFLTRRDSSIAFGYVLHGARGTTALLRGSAAAIDTDGDGAADSVRTTLATLPQAPFSSATLSFTAPLIDNPWTGCGSHNVAASVVSYSGAAAQLVVPYTVTNCLVRPDTTITSGVTGLTKIAKPTFAFTASPPTSATFECSIDGVGFTACPTPYTVPAALADGPHTFAVRAKNPAGVDDTPALKQFTVDTKPPAVFITSPSEGQVLTSPNNSFTFGAEPGAIVLCRVDSANYNLCSSPFASTGLAPGVHSFTVAAIDAVGNLTIAVRNFTVANPSPIVTITTPADGSSLTVNSFVANFTATSPGGTITGYNCRLENLATATVVSNAPCTPGQTFANLANGQQHRLTVTATDSTGAAGTATAAFNVNAPSPPGMDIYDGPISTSTTDRTPTFGMKVLGAAAFPNAIYQCAFTPLGQDVVTWSACGAGTEYTTYTSPDVLPNGDYTFHARSVDGAVPSVDSTQDFSVGNWDAAFSATLSTYQAGAHPDMDVDIKPAAGQLRLNDMLLPSGLIGGLTAFPKCAQASAALGSCPAASLIGRAGVDVSLFGLDLSASITKGPVWLTEPWQPGDTAGFLVRINPPIAVVAPVLIPLRVILTNNSQQMRVFSDSIPVTTSYVVDKGEPVNFYVHDFQLHIDGSTGSPFPLLTNPSSCAAKQITAKLGDIEGNAVTRSVPFQATGCASVPFSPVLSQTFTKPVAGSSTGVLTTVTVPRDNSSIKTIRVLEPPALGPNYPAFGKAADQCPDNAAPTTASFDPTNCPAQSKVGQMTIVSPLLPAPEIGIVYLINKSPLPWFGVVIDDPSTGVKINLVGATSTPQVDPTCDPALDPSGFCQTRISVIFANAPDLPTTSIQFNLDGPARTSVDGSTLSGDMTVLASPGNATCVPNLPLSATISPNTGQPATTLSQTIPITGC